ncbi:hypothetical protein [Streptomyces camelliae]|uniref:Uncharacterized protein n=1 Tax=Streptomyces camelliae TaxID=3004093 RepID=A0ABY7PBI9_9ACTN|nr:hypothetical protein [Streptomyces sp. HUAS 2-6]WBO65643.1 hypothetical protein O1G22_23905 [Streptomyces sp. HUAS 2-6]
MSGQANELDGAGDDAGHIHQAIQPTMCYTEDALGGPEAGAAFNAFAAAWVDDAATLESALHELAGKVRLAKGAYAGGDHAVATRAAAVTTDAAGLGNGVTTMPTPAGSSYVTTMPTPVGNAYVTTMPTPATGPDPTTMPAPDGGGPVTTMPVHADRPSALTTY